jgi:hypothetical protein
MLMPPGHGASYTCSQRVLPVAASSAITASGVAAGVLVTFSQSVVSTPLGGRYIV